jgi:PAS domain S-box-containing protein
MDSSDRRASDGVPDDRRDASPSAEERLRTSEGLLQTLFETMTEGVALNECVFDENGDMVDYRILKVNPRFAQIADFAGMQIEGNLATRLYGMSSDFIREFSKEHLKKDTTTHTEMKSPLNQRWFHIATSPFRDGRFVTSFFDITEQKRTEAQLRETIERYRFLNETAGVGIAYYTPEGTILSYNGTAARHMQGRPEDFVGKSIFEQFPRDQAQVFFSRLEKALLSDGPLEYIDKVDLPAGTKWFQNVLTVTHLTGKEKVVQIIATDITALKDAERQVALLKHSIDVIAQPAYVFGADHHFVYVNDAGCTQLGYAPGELRGVPLQRINPRATEERMAEIWRLIRAKGAYTSESKHLRKDGSELPVEIRSHYFEFDGQAYCCGFVSDLTDRRQAEEAQRRLEQESNKVHKLEALGILAGGIAHDFNNLLGAIYGYIDLAANTTQEEETAAYLAKALTSIDRTRGLTKQLLTFAKGGVPVKKVSELAPFIEETAKFALSGSNVACHVDLPEGLWACDYDKNQIGQVIDNIVINAQQAMPSGGAIDIRAANVTLGDGERPPLRPGNYVKISIVDTGIGMPSDMLPRIFDPFYTTKPKGHGLGLATSHSIVTRHHGTIEVESEMGKGSTFHVYLPASLGGPREESGRGPAKPHAGAGTIVVVDDEPAMLDVFRGMLARSGYEVVCFVECASALDAFLPDGAPTPVAVFFDLTIPGGMGGEEAVRLVRQKLPNLPVFVTSGYAVNPVMASPSAFGFTASLAKPFTLRNLTDLLSKYLRP